MKQITRILYYSVFFPLLLISCRTTEVIREVEEFPPVDIQQDVIRLIADMPADEYEKETWVNMQLVEMGSDAVRVLAGYLSDPFVGSDTQARYAITSLANYVSRPGADAERNDFELALLEEIQKNRPVEVKRFLIEQLKPVAGKKSVSVLEPLLRDPIFYQSALDVFFMIASDEAVNAVRNTIPHIDGNLKVAAIKTLGELRDAESVAMLQMYAESDRRSYQRMALFALSEIGRPGSSQLFREAMNQQEGFRKIEFTGYYLNYARRLVENGHYAEGSSIADEFRSGDYPAHIQNNALEIRFKIEGDYIVNELFEMAQTSEKPVAVFSLKLANTLSGEDVTGKMILAMENADAIRKPLFIKALAERKDAAAISAIRNYIDDNNSKTRIAALDALHQLDESFDPVAAISVLNRAESYDEINAIEAVMGQIESDNLIPAINENLQYTQAHAKPLLLRILNDRMAEVSRDFVVNELNSARVDVRIEALHFLQQFGEVDNLDRLFSMMDRSVTGEEKETLINTFAAILNKVEVDNDRQNLFNQLLSEASHLQRARLVETAPYVDGLQFEELIRQGFNHSYRELREASYTGLISWKDPRALPLIIEAITHYPDSQKQIELIDVYIQIVNSLNETVDDRAVRLQNLVESASNENEKAAIIGRFTRADELLALQASSVYFNASGNALRNAAFRTAASVLQPHYAKNSGLFSTSGAVLAVLDESTRVEIKSILDSQIDFEQKDMDEPEDRIDSPPFGELFNGVNLDGWEVVGDHPESWGVENGILYTDGIGSGWLSTTSVYNDFIIELEYRVPVGGNSGVFIRAPRYGNPAYQGMEIQILDDYADRFANLKPWQYTGSIYDVLAPSVRVTKPAGEWQQMKIVADGPNIQVTLNGEMILHANLINHMEKAGSHPGLIRRSGYIGLQNHSDRVEFRNIRVNPIK